VDSGSHLPLWCIRLDAYEIAELLGILKLYSFEHELCTMLHHKAIALTTSESILFRLANIVSYLQPASVAIAIPVQVQVGSSVEPVRKWPGSRRTEIVVYVCIAVLDLLVSLNSSWQYHCVQVLTGSIGAPRRYVQTSCNANVR